MLANHSAPFAQNLPKVFQKSSNSSKSSRVLIGQHCLRCQQRACDKMASSKESKVSAIFSYIFDIFTYC